jgi:hypothetical protein
MTIEPSVDEPSGRMNEQAEATERALSALDAPLREPVAGE